MSLMDENGDVIEDLKVPESDLGKEIVEKADSGDALVTVLRSMGNEAAIAIKNAKAT